MIEKWSIFLVFYLPREKIKTSIQWLGEGKENASTCNNGNVTKAKERKLERFPMIKAFKTHGVGTMP